MSSAINNLYTFGHNYALIMLKETIETLEEPERSIMIRRYYDDLTQCEVAENLGLKQTFVSRREQKVLKKIREWV